jgi:alkylmercury lyase
MTSPLLQKAIKTHEDFVAANPKQFRLWPALLRLLAEGKPVSPEQLAASSHRSLQEVQVLLHAADVRVDDEGNILALALSLVPAAHQFHLGEHVLYTWCALDTLAFPALLGRTARVISSCPVTGRAIHLTVTPETILDQEPASAVISVRLPGEDTDLCHVQEDLCNAGYFFVSHEVASAWPSLHPQAVLLSLEEAFELGRVLANVIRSITGKQE